MLVPGAVALLGPQIAQHDCGTGRTALWWHSTPPEPGIFLPPGGFSDRTQVAPDGLLRLPARLGTGWSSEILYQHQTDPCYTPNGRASRLLRFPTACKSDQKWTSYVRLPPGKSP